MSSRGTRKATSGEGWALVRSCPDCGRDSKACGCSRPPRPPGKATLRVRLEKRRGKPVTVVNADGLEPSVLTALLQEAKMLCGAGGTTRGAEMEVQGDHRERLRPLLVRRGYTVKG